MPIRFETTFFILTYKSYTCIQVGQRRLGVALTDQVLSAGVEVVEYVLLLQLGARFVPGLAVLSASPQIGHGVDATHLHPLQPGNVKAGS